MSGFIASPPNPASPAGAKISGGPFWPDIDMNAFRDAMRVGGTTIPDARLKPAIEGAIIDVGDDLSLWRLDQITLGFNTLAAVPAELVDGLSAKVILWRRAVCALAVAELLDTHRDVTATSEGVRRAEEQAPTADDHRRNAVKAIRAIMGRSRIIAELV